MTVRAQTPDLGTVPIPPEVTAAIGAASSVKYLPTWMFSAGGGAFVPGSGRFLYETASYYLGQRTYATAGNEYSVSKGIVQTCPLAGVTIVLYQFGPASAGTTGLGGVCSSGAQSAAALVAQGFLSFRFGKSPWSAVGTFTKPFLVDADGKKESKVTIGVVWAK